MKNSTFRRLLSALVCLTLLMTIAGTSASADGEVQHQDLFQLVDSRRDPSLVNRVYKVWTDTFGHAVTFINATPISEGNMPSRQSFICASLADSACEPTSPKSAWVQTVLGVCESPTEIGCIESVSYKNSELALEGLVLVSPPQTIRNEDASLGIPRGSTMSLWEASDGTRYVVAPVVQSSIRTVNKSWEKPNSTLSVSIQRVKRDYVIPEGRAEIRMDSPGRVGQPTLSIFGGNVAPTLDFRPGTFFKIAVRVPRNVSGFFRGRIANAVVESSTPTPSSTTYVIQGEASPTYIAGAEASLDDSNSPAHGQFPPGLYRSLSSATMLEDYTRWKTYIGDRALTTRHYWQILTSDSNEQRCFESSKKINGLVSSNSAFYSSAAPVFNATTGTFDFKVASPHFDENGNVAVGKYSLSVPLSVLQCLYGSDVIPGTAEISFTYADGSPTQTLQQSVTVAGDWANVSVSGLHFSSPTIRAKFKVPYRTTLAKGKAVTLRSLARTKSSQRPKWSASGRCKILGSRLVASGRPGTCKVTLRVLNSKKKYVVFLQRKLKVS